MKKPRTVDEYLAQAPREHRAMLRELRAIIKSAAPKAAERISYGMPFYEYNGRLAYFALQKAFIGLYIPPPILQQHDDELKAYTKTKSALHLPIDKKLPARLIKKLVLARVRYNEGGK
jgi:uncharacterized protein YdhG (YjbR/CyaY superfamily)